MQNKQDINNDNLESNTYNNDVSDSDDEYIENFIKPNE